jgi:hypothetical protein
VHSTLTQFCAVGLLVFAGCKDDKKAKPAKETFETGLGVVVRHTDGSPMQDGEVQLDQRQHLKAELDAAGMILFNDVDVGQYTINVNNEGYTTQHALVDIVQGRVNGAQFWLKALTDVEVTDTASDLVVDGDGFSFVFEAGTLTADAPYTLSYAWLAPEESMAIPGNLERQDPEGNIHHLDAVAAFQIPWPAGAAFSGEGQVRIDAPDGDPLRDRALRMYLFDSEGGHWRQGFDLVVEGDELVGTFNGLGWWAVAEVTTAVTCLSGTVLDENDVALAGAELLSIQPEAFGVLRTHAAEDGTFCLPTRPTLQGQVHTFGFSRTLEFIYKDAPFFLANEGPAECGDPGCLTLGQVRPDPHPDEDGDGYYEGIGDCDDGNSNVNPSLHFGDGSSCFDD